MIEIYICVCEAKVEQNKMEYLCCSFECILFSFYFLPFHLDFYI